MKASVVIATAILALGAAISIQLAEADSRQANCEVRKNGETKQGKSGACSFAQRQGYIDIDLRNGDVYNLRPGNKANHYRDQKGNKVVRTSSSDNTQEFKWEGGTRVIITFSSHGNNGHGHNQGQRQPGIQARIQRCGQRPPLRPGPASAGLQGRIPGGRTGP
ncbi:MAG: hypothetical protein IPJ97_14885 [Proteobacteria bacterium]|nr:hypothetical protein [Pseudomonadota bacterium]